jgi:hypothetical protein
MTHPMTLIVDGSLNGLQHIIFAIASEIPIFVVVVFFFVFFFLRVCVISHSFPGRFVPPFFRGRILCTRPYRVLKMAASDDYDFLMSFPNVRSNNNNNNNDNDNTCGE